MYINTQEWIRLKFFQIVIFLSLVFVCFSYLLGALSFAEQKRLIVDFGLAGIEISLVFIAAFFSTHSLAKDIERKTILVLLSRPIPRWKVILGYYGSLKLLNFFTISVLGATLYFFIKGDPHIFLGNYLVALFVILLKSLIIGSFGLFFSVIARPMFAFVLTLTYWLVSYSVVELEFFIKKINPDVREGVMYFFNFTLPQFYKYNWKTYGYLKTVLNLDQVVWAFAHSVAWIGLYLVLASIVFRRKEIV